MAALSGGQHHTPALTSPDTGQPLGVPWAWHLPGGQWRFSVCAHSVLELGSLGAVRSVQRRCRCPMPSRLTRNRYTPGTGDAQLAPREQMSSNHQPDEPVAPLPSTTIIVLGSSFQGGASWAGGSQPGFRAGPLVLRRLEKTVLTEVQDRWTSGKSHTVAHSHSHQGTLNRTSILNINLHVYKRG